jgi:hypothetical protein
MARYGLARSSRRISSRFTYARCARRSGPIGERCGLHSVAVIASWEIGRFGRRAHSIWKGRYRSHPMRRVSVASRVPTGTCESVEKLIQLVHPTGADGFDLGLFFGGGPRGRSDPLERSWCVSMVIARLGGRRCSSGLGRLGAGLAGALTDRSCGFGQMGRGRRLCGNPSTKPFVP